MTELARLLAQARSKYASRDAVVIDGEAFSYEQLFGIADRLAVRIEALDPGTAPVAIVARRSLEAYAGVLAAVSLGRPYVPLNVKLPAARKAAIVAMTGCRIIVSDSQHLPDAAEIASSGGTHVIGDIAEMLAPVADDAARPDPIGDGLPAYIMFTSGTTGDPKGVIVLRSNLVAYIAAIATVAPVGVGDRCSQLFDLSFDLSVHDIFVTLTSGGTLYIAGAADELDPVGFAARHKLDCWFSVPSVIGLAKRMRRLKPASLPDLRLSLFCGEPLSSTLAAEWTRAAPGSRLLNLYGPTEATIAITTFELLADRLPDRAVVPLGLPLPMSDAIAVKDDGEPAAVGETGELWLAGPQLSAGYFGNPGETARKFVDRRFAGRAFDRWYRTGDIVGFDADDGFLFQHRLDEQVKLQGYRIDMLEIEEALRSATGTLDVAAIAWPLSETGSAEGITGFVTDCGVDDAAVIAGCRSALPAYMVPQRIIRIGAIPLNANGKTDRAALRAFAAVS